MSDIKMIKLPKRTVIATFMPDDHRYGNVYGYTAKQMVDFGRMISETKAQRIAELEESFAGLNEIKERMSRLAAERFERIKELEAELAGAKCASCIGSAAMGMCHECNNNDHFKPLAVEYTECTVQLSSDLAKANAKAEERDAAARVLADVARGYKKLPNEMTRGVHYVPQSVVLKWAQAKAEDSP